ncbi:MAG: hypothetical protein ABIQ70_08335, partial [Dokdonella sp.]
VGPNGEKILHVEEIQSDWHQSGRKQGYGSAPITEVVRGGRTMFEVEENVYSSRDAAEAQAKKKGVPDAPFKKEWPMLAFKRALRMAVDKGYDKVTWTTGAQQADRFDLSKQVNSIDVVKQRTLGGVDRVAFLNMPGGRGDVDLHINSEGKITKGEYAGKGVDEVVGKEMAEKIMGVEDQKKFSGSDLRVGGEGMKAFYDKMLPNEVNKYVKQWGAKVGEASIDVNRGIAYDYSARKYMLRDAPGMEGKQFSTEAEARAAGSQGVHSLDITPAMVESVRAGQPLFSKPRKAAGVDDMFGAKDKEREKSVMRVPENSDLFGGPSTRDHLDAASRGKAAQRNGLNGGRADTGDGGLFDGERPEQTSIDQRGKTMFSKPRDDLSEQRTEDAPELPPLNNIGQAHSAAAAIMAVGDPKHMQELTRGDIRSALARRDRRVAQADASVNAFIKYFDKRPKEVREDPRQALADVIRFQRGEPTLDPLTRPFFASVRHLLDTQAAEIRSHGSKYLEHLVENYFPQQWEEPERTHAFYTDAMAKRPLAGGKKFTKERVFNDYEEGIAAGFKPISTNPADLLMGRYQAGEKLLASLRIMKALEDRGVVHDLEKGERIPVGFARVNDTSFTSKVIPELSAHDLNNYLDPGLTKFAAWRGFRYMQNLLLSARLGLSAFHAGMTTLDTIATHADIGWRRIALLHDVKGGLRELAKIPVAVYTSPKGGNKLMRQFEGKEAADPNTAAILDALAEGGARGKMNPVDYNDDYRKLMRAIDQGDARTIAMKAIPGAIEGTTRLIAHHLVPAQKMTARVMHMKFRLDQVSDDLGTGRGNYKDTLDALHPDTLKQISYEINATIDDRLGQFAYDNLFWNKTMKDALHASVQSVGWNWGSLRLIVGGIGDARRLAKPEGYIAPLDKAGTITNVKQSRLTDRLSYLITLNAVVGMMGATTQYLMTGQGPKDAKDFFFPRTGRKNADDTEERIAFPSYVKDEFSWLFHPLTTASHKLHPSLSMLTEIARNKDFYGTEVYDPDASIPTEAKQFLTYLGKSMMPYAIQGAAKNASTGTSAVMTALPFIGITPASGEVTKSKFQEYVADKYYDTLPSGARSQEKTDISANFKAAVKAARDGEQPDTRGFTGSQLKRLATEKQELVPQIRFKRLPINQQLNAWEKATPDERESYKLRAAIMHGGYAKIGREPEADQARLREQMKSVMASGAAAGD